MNCPSCAAPMTSLDLDGRLGRSVTIDLCAPCQAIWFDRYENLQLSPAATLKVFQTIGEHAANARRPLGTILRCPRCHSHLLPTHDMVRNTPFQYWRCESEHGRLTTYFDFLREKNFIRPLSAQQIAELRQNIQLVNCSNCGAPIDLGKESACSHCGSPLSMLDVAQVGQMVQQLQQADYAERTHTIDPTLPLRLEQARREVERSFASFSSDRNWLADATSGGLVSAGLSIVARWLNER